MRNTAPPTGLTSSFSSTVCRSQLLSIFKDDQMYLTDLASSVYFAKLDGSEKKPLLVAQGNLTDIAYAEISAKEH